MATIKDVAKAAGVSIATVSATINGKGGVSEKRSRRVWDAVEAVGYSPHGIARSLRLGRTQVIGLVVGDIANPFFTSLAKAVEARASAAGYWVIVANSDEEPKKELALLKMCQPLRRQSGSEQIQLRRTIPVHDRSRRWNALASFFSPCDFGKGMAEVSHIR